MKEELKDRVLHAAHIMWARRLSDIAGGNISLRDQDGLVCVTPKLMGFRFQWQIDRSHLSIVDPEGAVVEGTQGLSREITMHLMCYRAFPEARAVIHAHPEWTSVFVAKARAIVPVLETTRKFGTIGVMKETHGYSVELAEGVVEHFRARADQWAKTPLEVILPFHGIVAMARDMNGCLDIVDRIEAECRCQILGRLLD